MVDPKNNVGIIVQDDGVGMDRRRLVGMLSFGFSDKEHKAGNVGRFGIGFKSGSMRLARDALILTKRDGYAHVAFLSQTFLDDAELDDILIPMFSWRMERDATTGGRVSYVASEPANTKKWDEHMSVILRYSFVPSEPQLMRELDKIRGSHGTRIVLFNLRDPPELDFTSYKDDIRLVGAIPDDERAVRGPIFQQSREGQQASIDVQEDYSLRAYMEILYLKPRCEFTLRGRPVVPRDPIAHLAREYYVFPEYKPRGLDAGITIHIGYAADETSKKCGFHIYNKNRLIRMHQRFGSQLQANTMMKDMIGVIEADSLEPTHNKQAFKEADITYQKFKRHLVQCMQDYYFGIQRYRLAGGGGRGAGTTSLKQTAKRRKRLHKSSSFDEDDEDGGSDGANKAPAPRGRPKGGRVATPLTRIKSIHRSLMVHKNAYIFLRPVDPVYWEIPDYFEVIKNPMDLGTIKERIDAGYYDEKNVEAYAADVRLVWSNAMTYNKDDTPVFKMARIMSREFEYQWQTRIEDEEFVVSALASHAAADARGPTRTETDTGDAFHSAPTSAPTAVSRRENLMREAQVRTAVDDQTVEPSPAIAVPPLLVNKVAAAADAKKTVTEKEESNMERPDVKAEPNQMVRVPKALSTVIDESFFKILEEKFVQLETELAEERAANARYIDQNIKRGINGSSTVSVEEMKSYAGELERLRVRVQTREFQLDSSRAKVRALQEENVRLRDRLELKKPKTTAAKPVSEVRETKFTVRNATASELEKLYAYVEKHAPNIDIRGRGWRVDVFERKGGRLAGTSYKEFLSPSGHKLRSMKEVLAYVAMIDDYRATHFVDMKYSKGDAKPTQEQGGAHPLQTKTVPGVPVAAPAPMDTDDVDAPAHEVHATTSIEGTVDDAHAPAPEAPATT